MRNCRARCYKREGAPAGRGTRTSADFSAPRPRDRVRRARSESGRARMASASRPRPVRPARQVRRFKGPARRRPPPDRREFSLARRALSAAVRRVRAGWSGGPPVPQGLLQAAVELRARSEAGRDEPKPCVKLYGSVSFLHTSASSAVLVLCTRHPTSGRWGRAVASRVESFEKTSAPCWECSRFDVRSHAGAF